METIKRAGAISTFGLILTLVSITPACGQHYRWLDAYDSTAAVLTRIAPPRGFERVNVADDSFANWLRHLPLRGDGVPVIIWDGDPKRNQNAHWAVVDIDVGDRNLQQCADAVIRLRAEYLYSSGMYDSISFNFTSGDTADYRAWINGKRPVVDRSSVQWANIGDVDSSYQTFRDYLDIVFTYAGSYSLERELKSKRRRDLGAGDVFIQGGFPGHAVLVVDVAENKTTGEKVFLLAQSYMPAQDVHILKNPADTDLSPWYELDFGDTLYTPEWNFSADNLMSF